MERARLDIADVKKQMKAFRITRRELAKRVGVNPSIISHLLRDGYYTRIKRAMREIVAERTKIAKLKH